MAAMLGVASGRVARSFEIQVAKATNGQKNDYAEESTLAMKNWRDFVLRTMDQPTLSYSVSLQSTPLYEQLIFVYLRIIS